MFDTNDFDACGGGAEEWFPVDGEGFAPEFPFDDDEVARVFDGGGSFGAVAGSGDGSASGSLAQGDVLGQLLEMVPDAYVAMRLFGIDRSRLNADEAVDFAVVAERVLAAVHALQDDAILAAGSPVVQVQDVQVADRRPGREAERALRIEDGIREEIATALHWSLTGTADRLAQARLLAGPLTRTKAALVAGRIAPGQVRWIVLHAKRLPGALAVLAGDATDAQAAGFDAACARLQDLVLPVAETGTVARTRTAAERAVLVIDAAGEARRRAAARKTRDAFVLPEQDGLSLFAVRMATEQAHACLARVDALAHDDRFLSACDATIGERRAEAAAALLLAAGTSESGIPEPGLRAHVDITMDLATFLGLQDALGDAPVGADGAVAEIAGVGAVSADVVRGLLADPDVAVTMRRLVTDPMTGHLLDYGRRAYQVPDRLRDFITARDRVCRFPGCRRKAAKCQADHAVAWDDGGETNPANTGPLCMRHHQMKTHSGWTITNSHPDGSCAWTSPHGRHYQHEPTVISAPHRPPPPPAPAPDPVPPFEPPPF